MKPHWQQFEDEVANLFNLLGYEVQTDTHVQSGQTDVMALSHNRFKPNLIIECKFHENPKKRVSIDEVENFTARVVRLRSKGTVDQGYLVTNTGFSSQAKGSLFDDDAGRFVFLSTYDELSHRLLDTDLYLRDYVRRYEKRAANTRFVDLWSANAAHMNSLRFDMLPGSSARGTLFIPFSGPLQVLQSIRTTLPGPGPWTIDQLHHGLSMIDDIGSDGVADLSRRIEHVRRRRRRTIDDEVRRGTTGARTSMLLPATADAESFLADKDSRLMMLLGDFGCGKTTTMQHIMYLLAKRKLECPFDTTVRTPLLINLRNYNKVVDFDSLLITFLNSEVGVDHVNLTVFRRLNEMGRFVLLLDGFDEMARLVTAAERRITFRELCCQIAPQSKVVLSGRPGYFPDNDEMQDLVREVSGLRPANEEKSSGPRISWRCLQLMDPPQLQSYLKTALKNATGATRRSVRQLIGKTRFAGFARRPVLMNIIVESAEDLAEIPPESISLRTLYEVYTSKWIRREEDKGYFRILSDSARKSEFMGLMAVQMHENRTSSIHYSKLNVALKDHFKIDEAARIDHFSHDVRTCSFLSRDDDGNYGFIHKSLMEYFVAVEFSKGVNSVFRGAFPTLTDEILDFVDVDALSTTCRSIIAFRLLFDDAKEFCVAHQDFEAAARFRDMAQDAKQELAKSWPRYDGDPLSTLWNTPLTSYDPETPGHISERWRTKLGEVEASLNIALPSEFRVGPSFQDRDQTGA